MKIVNIIIFLFAIMKNTYLITNKKKRYLNCTYQ